MHRNETSRQGGRQSEGNLGNERNRNSERGRGREGERNRSGENGMRERSGEIADRESVERNDESPSDVSDNNDARTGGSDR